MSNFVIKTENGFYMYKNNFASEMVNAHVFEDILECFVVLEEMKKLNVNGLQMIELNLCRKEVDNG